MASIKDLESITTSSPTDLEDWLGRFDEEDRDVVVHAILTKSTNDVYPVLSNLDVNPYVFERATLNHHRRILKAGK